MIETIKNWVASFPGFGPFLVDGLGPGEGFGLFPRGERIVSRSADILGNTRLRRRLSFTVGLTRRKDPQGDDPGVQPVLEAFAQWVRRGAPVLGEDQTVRAEDAHLAALGNGGMARYEVKLIFEFTQLERNEL